MEFYSGVAGDHRGRLLSEIQAWPASRLEAVHDFIQWLFPLPEPSPVNPGAPVIDMATIKAFQKREDLRAALRRSLQVMTAFYGFRMIEGSPVIVEPTPSFESAAANWLKPVNHNLLRITRILRSTRLLGLPEESDAFFRALSVVYQTDRGKKAIGVTSFRFWQQAVL